MLSLNYRDLNGKDSWYECIGVLEHSRSSRSGEDSAGHYRCDVKDSESNFWFRTNDDRLPHQISVFDVFKNAYVILFKRKDF